MANQATESFPRKILKIAAAQIAITAGYTNAKESALEAVVDIMEMCLYILTFKKLEKKAHLVAEHNGRTQSSFIDLIFAMQQLGIDIFQFGQYVTKEEKLFIGGIPEFPVRKHQEPVPRAQIDPERPNIPGFLPDLPDARTYKNTPTYQKRHVDNVSLRKAELEVRHSNEDALINLKNKIVGDMKVNYGNAEEIQEMQEEDKNDK
ncbi:Transcription initiation factor TFIID subunit 8 [Entamoeba marina]